MINDIWMYSVSDPSPSVWIRFGLFFWFRIAEKSESRSETYEYRTVKLYNKQPPFASLTVNLYRFNRCGWDGLMLELPTWMARFTSSEDLTVPSGAFLSNSSRNVSTISFCLCTQCNLQPGHGGGVHPEDRQLELPPQAHPQALGAGLRGLPGHS